MIKVDRNSDLKLGVPFLDKDGNYIKLPYNVRIKIFTSETGTIKFAEVKTTYLSENSGYTYNFTNCIYKDVNYKNNITGESKVGPILIIPIDSPNFIPGNLKIKIFVDKPDIDFINTDGIYTMVINAPSNIQII